MISFELTDVLDDGAVMKQRLLAGLFPLPGMVAFAGQQHLLHVFEPRYRQLIRDCVDHQIPLGISLPKKELSRVDNRGKSFDELLASNQNTYVPSEIFGIGPVKLLKVLPDGRIIILVNVDHRVRLKQIKQSLPYYLAEVEVEDPWIEDQVLADKMYDRLLLNSYRILGDRFSTFEAKLPERLHESRDLSQLLLKIMDWFRLDAPMLQAILEEDLIEQRAMIFNEYMAIYAGSRESEDPDTDELQSESITTHAPPSVGWEVESSDTGDNVIPVDFGAPQPRD